MTLRLLIVAHGDLDDPDSWSGTPYAVAKALRAQGVAVHTLALGKAVRRLPDIVLRAVLGAGRYPFWITPAALAEYGRRLSARVMEIRPDAVLSISSQGLVRSALGIPTFLLSDIPWIVWQETYAGAIKRPLRARQFATLEAAAARRCAGVIMASPWAAGLAAEIYRIPREHSHAVPFGANWEPDLDRDALLKRVHARALSSRLELLFVGVTWERKGGPLALEVARALQRREVPVTLHVVGCTPELAPEDQALCEMHGFLSKSVPAQREQLQALYLDSHFLLTPATAEAYGLVFVEAEAFALPPIALKIHALPFIVTDGETGLLFDPAASAETIASRIIGLRSADDAYERMCAAARTRFETVLNWRAFAETVTGIIQNSLGTQADHAVG